MDVITRDGRTLERIGTNVPDSPDAPLDWDAVCRKFHDCAVLAARPPSTARVNTASQMTRDLESTADATDLLRILSDDPDKE